jgi:hypothetical protein
MFVTFFTHSVLLLTKAIYLSKDLIHMFLLLLLLFVAVHIELQIPGRSSG